jgi:hypothetical protein
LFTEIEFALFVAFINGVPGGKVKEKRTRAEEEKEMLNFYLRSQLILWHGKKE